MSPYCAPPTALLSALPATIKKLLLHSSSFLLTLLAAFVPGQDGIDHHLQASPAITERVLPCAGPAAAHTNRPFLRSPDPADEASQPMPSPPMQDPSQPSRLGEPAFLEDSSLLPSPAPISTPPCDVWTLGPPGGKSMGESIWARVALVYYQYEVTLGIYMLEPTEKMAMNGLLLMLVAMVAYVAYLLLPVLALMGAVFWGGLHSVLGYVRVGGLGSGAEGAGMADFRASSFGCQ